MTTQDPTTRRPAARPPAWVAWLLEAGARYLDGSDEALPPMSRIPMEGL